MNTKIIVILILVGATLVSGGILFYGSNKNQTAKVTPFVNNVSIANGKQIIEIYAKGGYYPRKSVAKAGIPTILRFNTRGTFDCSSSVRIASMNISKILPPTGSTDINMDNPKVGIFQGTCGMGMYSFEVDFRS